MADIRVKPTKRTPFWVWLLLVIVLVAAGVALYVFWPSLIPAALIPLPL